MELSLADPERRFFKGDMMSDRMKKRPRSKSKGGDLGHHALLHERPAEHFDDIAAEIDRMPRDLVRRKLRDEFKIDPDQAVARLKGTIDNAVETLRRGHHQTKEALISAVGHGERVVAGRGVVVSAAGVTPLFAWSSTQLIADALRRAATPDERLAAISHGFEHLGVQAGALRIHCAADPDAVWPLIECVYETAIAVAGMPDLWKPFAAAHAELAQRMSPVHQCMLVHNVHELQDGDAVPRALAEELGAGLAYASLSEQARILLARRSAPISVVSTEDTIALMTNPVADPLSSFSAMDALGAAAESESSAPCVIETLVDSLRSDSVSHFFIAGALARFRRRDPNQAASKMAHAASSASDRGRYAVFLAAIKGYEQSFRGRRQEVVPQFDLEGEPKFVPGAPHALDVFGELVCESAAARELHPQMRWANRRLAMWLSR